MWVVGMNSSLLPLNALPSERAIEATVERSSQLPVAIDSLWNPASCPENLLPWLAWALSVDTWNSGWPETLKRQVIAESVAIHRKKGTVDSVRRAMAVLGVQVELREWFEQNGAPHTFSLTAWAGDNFREDDQPLLTSAYYSSLKQAVAATKPVRSHYEFKVGIIFGRDLGVAAVTNLTGKQRMSGEADYPGASVQGYFSIGGFQQPHAVVRVSMELLSADEL